MSRNTTGFVFPHWCSLCTSVNWTVCQTRRDTNCCRVSSRRRVSGWHSCWTVPANWAGFSSSRCSASPSCSSTTVSPSHPTAYICCCFSHSEYGTALLSGTSKGSCSSGCWLWCLHGAGSQVTQVGYSSYVHLWRFHLRAGLTAFWCTASLLHQFEPRVFTFKAQTVGEFESKIQARNKSLLQEEQMVEYKWDGKRTPKRNYLLNIKWLNYLLLPRSWPNNQSNMIL